ncbi:MAG: metal-dependent hydrolase [Bryobacterales bacterium]|nr:metal-dependent hydrolase [Bryobacterales bacterium]MBV9397005.1 metal-dependent hydrolase [Bryobacterales bacterium]
MDNLTHSLTGLMLARAGLAKSGGRGATLAVVVAANAPDFDVLWAGLPGGLRYFQYHRGITHSLAFSPVLALVPLVIALFIGKSSLRWQLYLACWLGVLSHLAMDLTNVYGVRLLLPFSSRWLRLDTTDLIDPWILLTLILAIAAPALASLVSSEIASRRSAPPKRAWAWFAIIAIVCYGGFRLASHQRAIAVMESRLYGSLQPPKFAALPDRINPLRWRGLVITEDFVITTNMLLTEPYDPTVFGRIDYPTRNSTAIDAAKTTDPFEVLGRFSQLPFWKVSPAGDNVLAQLIDLRFGTPQQPGFASASALVTPDGRVLEARLGPLGFR